jgi:cytochrome c peroxidase
LEEVVEFYNSGAIRNFPADPFITKHPNGLQLTSEEKADLVAFLKCMTDSTLITNPDYK